MIEDIVQKFERRKPKHILQIEELGLPLTEIGDGLFRTVYHIEGEPLVIKVPNHSGKECRMHALAEYKAIRRINRYKKYERFRRYVPKVYYFDEQSGVMIQHYYKPVQRKYRPIVAGLLTEIVRLIWPFESHVDIHGGNVGLDEDNRPVMFDLGYFLAMGKGW